MDPSDLSAHVESRVASSISVVCSQDIPQVPGGQSQVGMEATRLPPFSQAVGPQTLWLALAVVCPVGQLAQT
jgi:hypothetical protein